MTNKSKHATWIEVLATVLMALTTISTAWCAFQSHRWSSAQTFLLGETSGLGRQASELNIKANQLRVLDVAMFMQYLAAFHNEKTELADYYRQHFRPEMKQAFEVWMQQKQELGKDAAPPHPFVMKEYVLAHEVKAKDLQQNAEEKREQGKQANRRADNYVMLTVLFASVLFFAGMATKFESIKVRNSIVFIGIGLYLSVMGYLLTLPVR
jgi:hypothetical protein